MSPEKMERLRKAMQRMAELDDDDVFGGEGVDGQRATEQSCSRKRNELLDKEKKEGE